jgi:hypothetical protein
MSQVLVSVGNMPKWEYQVISLDQRIAPTGNRGFDVRLMMALKGLGEDGWELAALTDGVGDDVYICVKRPLA